MTDTTHRTWSVPPDCPECGHDRDHEVDGIQTGCPDCNNSYHPGACVARHESGPDGYIAWQVWAEDKSRTHEQEKCPGCGLYLVWKPKAADR